MYNEGMSRSGDIIDLGVQYEILTKRGAFYRYGEQLLGQGRENSKTFLRENREIMFELENLIRQEAGLPLLEQQELEPA